MNTLMSHAPTGAGVDPTQQWIFMIVFVVASAGVIAAALRGPLRRRDWTEAGFRSLILVGATLLAFFVEPAIDHMGGLWYSRQGDVWRLITIFGITIPLWVAPCYLASIGALILVATHRLRHGATAGDVWRITGLIFVANLLVEIPILTATHLYTYYGPHQPFFNDSWFPVPGWLYTTNVVFVLLPSFLLALIAKLGRPRLLLLTPVVIISGAYAAYALVGWPALAALNNGAGAGASHALGVLSLAIGFFAIHLMGRWAPLVRDERLAAAPVPVGADPGQRAPVGVAEAASA